MRDPTVILTSAERRGLAPPHQGWFLQQGWCHVVFVNVSLKASAVQELLPPSLEPDLFDNQAWISLVIFRCVGSRLRGLRCMQTLPDYTEFNLRTYVRHPAGNGVHFLQLRTGSWLTGAGARILTQMPYLGGHTLLQPGSQFTYQLQQPGQVVNLHLAPTSDPDKLSLDRWLSERYWSYQVGHWGRLCRHDVRHTRWNLMQVRIGACELDYRYKHLRLRGADVGSVAYSSGVDALLWRGRGC